MNYLAIIKDLEERYKKIHSEEIGKAFNEAELEDIG